jgi:hypothetical protein
MGSAPAVVKIEGLAAFRRSLKKAGADMADMKSANEAAAQTVARAGSARAPRRSGQLSGSLRPARQLARARVTSSLPYAGVIEFGWPQHNISPSEFLQTAAVDTQPEWLAEYERDLQKIANTVHGA